MDTSGVEQQMETVSTSLTLSLGKETKEQNNPTEMVQVKDTELILEPNPESLYFIKEFELVIISQSFP